MTEKDKMTPITIIQPGTGSEPTHAEIALLAFTISQSQQGHHRSPEENWYEAERLLKEERFKALAAGAPDVSESRTAKKRKGSTRKK